MSTHLSERTEPSQINSGDAVTWTRAFAAYPSTVGFTLAYVLINARAKYDIAGDQVVANGVAYVVAVPSAITATWTAGTYRWQAYITDAGGNRHTVDESTVVVLPNLQAQSGGFDDREQDEKILSAIKDLIAGKVLAGDAQLYEIHGRKLQRYTFSELENLRDKYALRVRNIRIRRGEKVPSRSVRTAFCG